MAAAEAVRLPFGSPSVNLAANYAAPNTGEGFFDNNISKGFDEFTFSTSDTCVSAAA